MTGVLMVGYLALGVVQILAITSALLDLGAHWLLSCFLALFITCIPLVGASAGVYGAVVWGLMVAQGIMLFFGPLFVITALALVSHHSAGLRSDTDRH